MSLSPRPRAAVADGFALETKAVSRWWAALFGCVFHLLPREFLLKTSTHVVSTELTGKEFVQTIKTAEMGRPGGQAWGPRPCCALQEKSEPSLDHCRRWTAEGSRAREKGDRDRNRRRLREEERGA